MFNLILSQRRERRGTGAGSLDNVDFGFMTKKREEGQDFHYFHPCFLTKVFN